MKEKYLEVEQDAGTTFYFSYQNKGKITMLNMLKFRRIADYSDYPEINPEHEITGEEAYKLYIKHTLPHLEKAGSKVIYFGKSSEFLIGPQNETWDAILMVEHESVTKFMEFAQNQEYLKTAGHRIAALEDSRLLPSIGGEIK